MCVAIGQREIERRNGRRDVKRHTILLREDGYAIGADLVRHVAISGDPVGPDDHTSDASSVQEMPRHVVGDEGRAECHRAAVPIR